MGRHHIHPPRLRLRIYTQFEPPEETTSWFRLYTGNDAVTGSEFRIFGTTGAGDYIGFWLARPGLNTPLTAQPVVYFSSEGQFSVIARDLGELLWVFANGSGPAEALEDPDRVTQLNEAFWAVAERYAPGRRRATTEILAAAKEEFPGFTRLENGMSQASRACFNCRTLKRKCSREVPACALCLRLGKTCIYEGARRFTGDTQASPLLCEQNANSASALTGLHKITSIQSRFFLDSDAYRPMSLDAIPKIAVPEKFHGLLSSQSDVDTVFLRYFSGIHRWLPILSQKEIYARTRTSDIKLDAGFLLLVLSMKLSTTPPLELQDVYLSPLYQAVTELSCSLENSGLVSLDLIQSLILMSVYQIAHGLYPAGYMTVARAARLGALLGLHNRDKTQLYGKPNTWTGREGERRTWWAIGILNTFTNMRIPGLLPATPPPGHGDLLPCAEDHWDSGQVGSNQPLFVDHSPADFSLGLFANTCQAAHLLGNVVRHRDNSDAAIDRRLHLSEAYQLHLTLVSLSLHLSPTCFIDDMDIMKSHFVALALCCCARMTLYGMYGCNENSSTGGTRIVEEISMQQASIEGLYEVVEDVGRLAEHILLFSATSDDTSLFCLSPLFSHCLYLAISESAWFYREEQGVSRARQLRSMIEALQALGRVWRTVDGYMALLQDEGALFVMSHD